MDMVLIDALDERVELDGRRFRMAPEIGPIHCGAPVAMDARTFHLRLNPPRWRCDVCGATATSLGTQRAMLYRRPENIMARAELWAEGWADPWH